MVQERADRLQFIIVYRVTQPFVDPDIHIRAERGEHPAGFLDAVSWNVGIRITAAEESRSPLQRTAKVETGSRRSDQTSAQHRQSSPASGISSCEFRREACSLRETEQKHSIRRNPLLFQQPNRRAKSSQRRVEPGLILVHGCQERIRIPAAMSGRRGHPCGTRSGQNPCEFSDPLGASTSAMHEQDGGVRLTGSGSQSEQGKTGMQITTSAVRAHAVVSIGGRAASIRLRADSYHGGNRSSVPRVSSGSSISIPGGSVAISNNTPPGSRK